MDLDEAFSLVLKELRSKKGISQEKLAELCDLDRTYISLLERKKRLPTLATVFKIANALSINPTEFVNRVELLMEGKDENC